MWTAPALRPQLWRTRRERTFNQPSPSAVPKRLQRACNVPLPEHAEHLKIGGAGEIRTHGADNRTTDANQAWDFCGCGSLPPDPPEATNQLSSTPSLRIAEHEMYGLSEWPPSHVQSVLSAAQSDFLDGAILMARRTFFRLKSLTLRAG